MAKNKAVFGIYANQQNLREGLAQARAAGFRNTDLSVLFPENLGTKEFAHSKSSKAPEGATAGASSGAVIGGALGWLAGIGSLAIPGIGPFIAAGPIMGLLAGIGAGGAVGGILGGLIGMGVPEYEAKRYEGRLRSGGILVSVHCDGSDWVSKAKEILERTGAEDIATESEGRADFAASDKPAPRRAVATVDRRAEGDNMTIRELMVRKIETVNLSSTLRTAMKRMDESGVDLLVVRSGEDVVGVVTNRQVRRAVSQGHDPENTSVRLALTQDYPYCFEDQYPSDVKRTMAESDVKDMLVLNEDRRAVGVISMNDLSAPKERQIGRGA